MSYRVAIASSDGKYVNQHFGRATQFLIFDRNEQNEFEFIGLRANCPSCNWEKADESRHQRTIETLADCQAVIVSRIGPGAVEKLAACGIRALEIPDFIDEALRQLSDATEVL
ncbi:putative Fe-Mo cluster-binding NifX family protein [Hydrogenispora ethanolica]|uniref:Putative Fe-Mo cluster-binding NifX family protein n=1 Tax=Hydrogenispora ethanolica TaxID=1082276 RepID=A0A4V2QEZ1_HYDET|nr:NifB/NifX family molybdenum-iron cluster-binding protein [Hydrogenispora ethanolica]TCL69907.1 putative Fe-Mo cluster-binding NifX family protein [Hydrogenispora ethanolica]